MPSENDIPPNKSEQRIVLTTKDGRCVIVHFFLNDYLQPTVKTSGDINENDWLDVVVIGHIDATINEYDGVIFMVHLGSDTYVTYGSHGDVFINENGRFYIQSDGDKQNANCPYSMEYMEDEEHYEEFELITNVNGALKDFSSESEDEKDIRKPIVEQRYSFTSSVSTLDANCYNIINLQTDDDNRNFRIHMKPSDYDYFIDGMFVGYGSTNYVQTNFQIIGALPWYSLLNPIKDRSRAIPFFIVNGTMYVDNVKDTDVQYLTIERSEPTAYQLYVLNNVIMPMEGNSAPCVKGDVFFATACVAKSNGVISSEGTVSSEIANHVSYIELPSDLDVYACNLFDTHYTELETVVFHNNKFRNPQQNSYNPTYTYHMFDGCTSLTSLDLEGCDTSEINTLHSFCYTCTSLTSASLKGCDLSNVSSTIDTFRGCTVLTEVDFSGCDLSNVANSSGMFTDCSALQTIKAVGCNQATIDLLNQVKPQNATVVTTEQP